VILPGTSAGLVVAEVARSLPAYCHLIVFRIRNKKMKNKYSRAGVALLSVAVAIPCALMNASVAEAKGKARGHLYSTAAVYRFCTSAQQIIANTNMKSENIVWGDLGTPGSPFPPPGEPATGFIGSDALPYDGAEDEPLTTQQYVGYGMDERGERYPQTMMCKMKSWDALDFYYPDSASEGADCSAINQDTATKVINSLAGKEKQVVQGLVFDEWVAHTGQQWTNESPAVTAYTSTVDGKVHIVGKALYVNRLNTLPFIPASKKGVHYCQVIAPEYLKEVITGDVEAPTCDAPPVYSPPVGPPSPPPIWGCSNP
jgi:hypothetical protein